MDDPARAQDGADVPAATLSADEAADLVVRTIQAHAQSLLRVARRHSLCADDAQDAYQRAMEIFLRRAPRLDPAWAGAWLHKVVKHEAMAVRDARLRMVGDDLDGHEARDVASPEDRLLSFDHVTRSAEALQRLKPQEVRALWLKASGHSYAQIAEETGWSYTKVNRAITEGRRSFLARYASIEAGAECDRWAPVVTAIVDGEATREQLADARPHLRNCVACRATAREARRQTAALRALFPVAAAGAVPSPGPSDTGGFFARLYELVVGGVHDRATSSALKVQAAVETASAGKLAAVAASAAALTGGGIAVVDDAVDRGRPAHRRAAERDQTGAAAHPPKAPAARSHGRPAAADPPTSRRSAAAREFGSTERPSSAAAEFPAASPTATSSSSGPTGMSASPPPPPAPRWRRPAPVDHEFGP